jgi:hypothetical protein
MSDEAKEMTPAQERMAKVRAAKLNKPEPVEEPAISEPEIVGLATDELSKSEVRQLEEEIKREVRAEKRKTQKTALKKELRKKYEQQIGVSEGEEQVTIDVAKHSDGIMLDGVKYLHGTTYTVRASVATVLRDIMQATHWHQAEIDGKPKRYYTEKHQIISPHGRVNASQLLRA